MKDEAKIIVCTVTFNSSLLLGKMIDAVMKQSRPVYKIIVADNNSNPEHKERLRNYEEGNSLVQMIWLSNNTGGAGGFYAAMKAAAGQYQPDWYWLMDDDAYPEPDCLEKLLRKSDKLDRIGFLAPVIFGIDNKKYQLYHARVKRGYIYKFGAVADSIEELKDVEQIDVDAFVGPLIPGDVVRECGFPRAGYFIEGDDTDYCFRITRKYNGYLIKDAQMNHRDLAVSNGINPEGWWKQYYWFRNSILFLHNNTKGLHKLVSIVHFIGFAWKQKIKMYADSRYKGYRHFRWRILRKGLIDGLLRREGPRVIPAEYRKQLKDWEKARGM